MKKHWTKEEMYSIMLLFVKMCIDMECALDRCVLSPVLAEVKN